MTIKHMILGYLSWKPMTGYDVKKIIAHSEILPWSANNNQIYKALVDMNNDGWVEKTIETQEGSPNRHVYTITGAGKAALQAWAAGPPEIPSGQKPFLHQLMWAEGLENSTIGDLLEAYIEAVGEKLFLVRVQAQEGPDKPGRSPRESFLWDMIHRNWIAQYEAELEWARSLRQEFSRMENRLGY